MVQVPPRMAANEMGMSSRESASRDFSASEMAMGSCMATTGVLFRNMDSAPVAPVSMAITRPGAWRDSFRMRRATI